MTWLPELRVWGRDEDPLVLVLHGTGSNPDFVRRTFFNATTTRGYSLASYRLRGHGPDPGCGPYDLDQHVADLDALISHLEPAIVGGISLGAHITATWGATAPVPSTLGGFVLALPAWMGSPDAVAAANAHQAREIERLGVPDCLARLRADLAGSHAEWVADEMAATWMDHDERSFCAVLDAVARSNAPDADLLAQVPRPVGIAAVVDDPLHPGEVAHRWAAALKQAQVVELSVATFGRDRAALGEAAMSALDLSGSR